MPAEDTANLMDMSNTIEPVNTQNSGEMNITMVCFEQSLNFNNYKFQNDDMFIIKQKHLEAVLGIHEGTPLATELINAEDSVTIARAVISSLDVTALDNEDATISTVEELLHQIASDIQTSSNPAQVASDQIYGVAFKNAYMDSVATEKSYIVVKYFLGCMNRVGGIISSTVS